MTKHMSVAVLAQVVFALEVLTYKMVKRTFLETAIDALSDGRILVQGGCLNASLAWVPHADLLLEVDNEMYIVLSSTDYGFASLCGLQL